MLFKIICILLFVNHFCSAGWDIDEDDGYGDGKAPFFEIPCMRIGGTCAQSFACPPGTKVGQKGLCPEQQRFGVECCRPLKGVMGCRSQDGTCIPSSFKCSSNSTLTEATGCGENEICCLRRSDTDLKLSI